MASEQEIESNEPFYNCSKCSSPIKIIFLDEENIKFKCFNKTNPHYLMLSIKEYINEMEKQYQEENNEKCMLSKHKHINECYCLECNMHLCEICLKSKEHLFHNKINIKEILPSENEIKLINNIIKDIKNQDLKKIYEIIFNTYNNNKQNYYYCINMNYILNNYIEKNKSLIDTLSKEEYEKIIKIKNGEINYNKNNYEEIINNILNESEKNELKYKIKLNKLKFDINEYKKEISNLNRKISKKRTKKRHYQLNNKNKNKKLNLLENIDNIPNINTIKVILEIKLVEIINNNILLFNSYNTEGINVYLNNKKINMIIEPPHWKIDYNFFEEDGIYEFEIIFNNNKCTNMSRLFENCENIISIDLTMFNTENVTNMSFLFNNCNKLKEIKGINKFNTDKVTNMNSMFKGCAELEYLDLSSFNMKNVIDKSNIFQGCNKLKDIKGINKFNTNEISFKNSMIRSGTKLEGYDLSCFHLENSIDCCNVF